eukprot:CAMPEP_0181524400 /NCGR_PEP_ID=MMETSP1110-20121109/68412_1 /TAXON_ID=174948 /ORGANISM="Symbiodinium sp., Strain CCMP421" /LENGTH=168 /DNA_ID=CAMNT_0023655131 /DNA_START=1 /DNA_END=503 /DNA_ORIENTATION=-
MANEAKLFERQATSLSASTVDKERPEGWTSLYGFERVANFRDFAGPDPSAVYRCEGGHLKQGLLYRTGHWVTATPADLCLIRELDVRTYLDLRNGQEFESVDAECFDDFPPSPNGRHDASVPREPGERQLRSEAFHDVQVQLKTSMRAMLILNSDEVLKALETLTDER